MPCYDDRSHPDNVKAAAMAEFRHNSDVAEMLCYVLTNLEKVYGVNGVVEMLPVATAVWWDEHKERDKHKAA